MLRKTTSIDLKPWLILGLMALGIKFGQLHAQVKFGNNPGSINANSVLELESTTKGFLLPRLALSSTSSASPMSAHVAGMIVYNTATAGSGNSAVTPGYYYNDGSKWNRLSAIGDVSLIATSLTSATTPAGSTAGQMAYNTNPASGLPVGPVYWDGSKWVSTAPGTTSSVSLVSSTSPAGTAIGQVAYNTSSNSPTGLIYWDGSKWNPVNNANAVSLSSSTTPAGTSTGQMIYNTNSSSGVPVGPAYWDGSKWVSVSPGTSSSVSLTSSTSPAGTTVGQMVYNTNSASGLPVGPVYWDGSKWVSVTPGTNTTVSLTSSTTPAGTSTGQMAYNTNSASGLPVGPVYWDGSKWVSVSPGSTSNISLTSSTSPAGTSTGQMAYNTNASSGLPVGPVYWDGSKWVSAAPGSTNNVSLTSSTTPAGTTVGQVAYNTSTTVPTGLIYWDGSKWVAVNNANALALSSTTTPAGSTVGQMAYNTNASSGLPVGPVYWDGSKWVSASPGSTNSVSLTSSTTPAGTTVGQVAYNTSSTAPTGLIYWDGSKWVAVNNANALSLTSSTSPAGSTVGQMAYNTNASSGLPVGPMYWDGSKWVSDVPGTTSSISLTSSTAPGGTSIGQVAYNTSSIAPTGLVYWDGSKWVAVNNANALSLTSSTSPAGSTVGQMAYNTNASSGLPVGPVYWDGSAWKADGTSGNWTLKGNAGTSASNNFIGTTDNVDVVFKVNNAERLRLNNQGQILTNAPIITSAPIAVEGSAFLSVNYNALNNYSHLFLGGNVQDVGNGTYRVFTDGASNYLAAIKMDNQGSGAGEIKFITKSSTGGSQYVISNAGLDSCVRMSIVGSKVGIGTTSPQGVLDIKGISGANSGAVFKSGTNGDPTLSFYNTNSAMTRINSTLGGVAFYSNGRDNSTNLPDLTLANGKVGIGTNSPGTLLEINNGTTPGAIKIVDGNQGLGRVLVSDANGLATWSGEGNIVHVGPVSTSNVASITFSITKPATIGSTYGGGIYELALQVSANQLVPGQSFQYGVNYRVYHIMFNDNYPGGNFAPVVALVSNLDQNQTNNAPTLTYSVSTSNSGTITFTATRYTGDTFIYSYTLRRMNSWHGY